jgi:outer membrane protein insertion porin family
LGVPRTSRIRLLVGLCCAVLVGWFAPLAHGQEGETVAIESVAIEGLQRIPAETLLAAIPLRAGVDVVPGDLGALVRESIKRIFATGYFSDAQVYAKDGADGALSLTFVVLEKYVVRKINLVGNDEVEEEDIRKTFSVKTGRFLDVTTLIATLRSIEELYQDKGYFLAEASYEVSKDPETRTALVTIRVKEQAEVAVSKVHFVGNEQLTDDELKSIMMTREKGYLSFLEKSGLFLRYFFQLERDGGVPPGGLVDEVEASQFESWSAHQDVDLQRVKWFYMTRGFVEAKLGQPRISLTPGKDGIMVLVDVQEGQPYDVGKVDIITDDPDGLLYSPDDLKADLKLVSGARFDAQNVMMDTDGLSKKFMNKGYAYVSVSNSHNLDRDQRTLDLTYVVQKGKPTYVANIEVTGNKTTADKVVRREMKIAEGDLYHQGHVDRSKALIFRLGFFEDVEIIQKPAVRPPAVLSDPTAELPQFVDLVVRVKEKDTGIFQVGAGFSSLESYILQARISKNNFLGRGQTISVQALVSSLRSIYMLSFVEPYFLDTPWSFSFDLYDTATDYEAFTTEALGGNVSWGYRFLDDYYVYLTYKVEQMKTTLGGRGGFGGVPIDRLEQDGITSSLRFSLAWDTRNNRIMPTDGFYNSASAEWASPYLGGDSDFYRGTLNSRWYIPLFWNFILRLNGTMGYVGTTSQEPIPIFERYYVGGIFSVRGFQRNSLSPTIPAAAETDPSASLVSFPIGGNKQLIFNAEIEIPIYRPMGIVAVLFFDAGNAFAEEESLDFLNLRTSAGFGFRWWSPMGPLRFEWGFPLKPLKGEEPMVFEFTIGSAF